MYDDETTAAAVLPAPAHAVVMMGGALLLGLLAFAQLPAFVRVLGDHPAAYLAPMLALVAGLDFAVRMWRTGEVARGSALLLGAAALAGLAVALAA